MPSNPPSPLSLDRMRARSERVKVWSGIIAMILGNIVALTTAVLAHYKEETGAKNVYQELSGAIEKVSYDQIQLHKDVSAIRGYLAGQAKHEPTVLWTPKNKDKKTAVRRTMPPIRIGVGVPKPSDKEEPIAVIPPQAPPPNITPEPDDYEAPPVDAVVNKK
jgi:hypothetical protein